MRRRRLHLWTPILLLCASSAVLYAWMTSGGPYDDDVTFSFVSVLHRKQLGYQSLPEYDRNTKLFRAFPNGYWQWRGAFTSYCIWDEPYWPDGDPGLGEQNPLPLLVQRHHIYGLTPVLPFGALALMWLSWLTLFIFDYTRAASLAPGFPLVSRVADSPDFLRNDNSGRRG